jgi:hypothetical protein
MQLAFAKQPMAFIAAYILSRKEILALSIGLGLKKWLWQFRVRRDGVR